MSLVFQGSPAGRTRVMTILPPRPGPRHYSLKSGLNLWHYYITTGGLVKYLRKNFFCASKTFLAAQPAAPVTRFDRFRIG